MIRLSSWSVFVLTCAAMGRSVAASAQPMEGDTANPSTQGWTTVAPMQHPRYFHTATELCNGKVLVVGGITDSSAQYRAELYDPALDDGVQNPWKPVNTHFPHWDFHTATLIPKGCRIEADGTPSPCQVLITGGNMTQPIRSVETYQEDDGDGVGSFREEPAMVDPRSRHTATPIADGCKVLVAGGFGAGSHSAIYDAATRSWSPSGNMHHKRYEHVAGALPYGGVIAVGGFGDAQSTATAERWDKDLPPNGQWVEVAAPHDARRVHSGCTLTDGRFFVAGGQIQQDIHDSAELYDLSSDTWTLLPSMSTERTKFTCTALPDNRVLVTGGPDGVYGPPTEIFDPTPRPGAPLGTWTPWKHLTSGRNYAHTATLLSSTCPGNCQPCEVLAIGGYSGAVALKTAEKSTMPAQVPVTP
jgi:hypothetical protein